MTNRRALTNHPFLTVVVLAVVGWLLVTAARVVATMEATDAYYGYVGNNATSGWIGLAVIAVTLGLLLVFFAELPADDPMPDRFPPDGEWEGDR